MENTPCITHCSTINITPGVLTLIPHGEQYTMILRYYYPQYKMRFTTHALSKCVTFDSRLGVLLSVVQILIRPRHELIWGTAIITKTIIFMCVCMYVYICKFI